MKLKDLLGSPTNALIGSLATVLVGALINAIGKKLKSGNQTNSPASPSGIGDTVSAAMPNFDGQSGKGQGLGAKGQGRGGGQGGCGG